MNTDIPPNLTLKEFLMNLKKEDNRKYRGVQFERILNQKFNQYTRAAYASLPEEFLNGTIGTVPLRILIQHSAVCHLLHFHRIGKTFITELASDVERLNLPWTIEIEDFKDPQPES